MFDRFLDSYVKNARKDCQVVFCAKGDCVTKTAYKYHIKVQSTNVVTMPKGAQILTCQEQGNKLTLWAIVDPNEAQMQERIISVYGTGHPTERDLQVSDWIATVQIEFLVWHVFEHVA